MIDRYVFTLLEVAGFWKSHTGVIDDLSGLDLMQSKIPGFIVFVYIEDLQSEQGRISFNLTLSIEQW